MPVAATLTTPDLIVLGICAVLALRGAIKGFTWQLIQTVGLVGAIWAAGQLNEPVGDWIRDRIDPVPDASVYVVGWCVVMIGGWLLVTFVAHMARGAIRKAELSGMDRTLGLALGAFTGFVIATAIFVGYGRFVSSRKLVETLDASVSARYMAHVIDVALPLVPEPVASDWQSTFDDIREAGDED